jgi:hypothetical protein
MLISQHKNSRNFVGDEVTSLIFISDCSFWFLRQPAGCGNYLMVYQGPPFRARVGRKYNSGTWKKLARLLSRMATEFGFVAAQQPRPLFL